MRLAIFDPSRHNQKGDPSTNLGDLIIRDAISCVLQEIFPGMTSLKISTHTYPTAQQIEEAQEADLVLVAGTNLLSSNVLKYDQWKLLSDPLLYADPPVLDAVLCGVGWWQYQPLPDIITRYYYQRLLRTDCPQSVRDGYTQAHLAACGVKSILNTSCPTLWGLHGHEIARSTGNRRCLFCLTDYAPDQEKDDQLVRQLASLYPDELFFFPQGDHDLEYARRLPVFSDLAERITIMSHDYEALSSILGKGRIDYVGTRLHAGVWCLDHGLPSLILSVDNRATEIGRETTLPVIPRGDEAGLARWHKGLMTGTIRLPQENIAAWKQAVCDAAEAKRVRRMEAASPSQNSLRLLNLGCGGRARQGWTNVDQTSTSPGVIAHDLRQPLPFEDRSFDAVYFSHVLEHFSREQAAEFLAECHRVLRPGGILRVVVPDLEWLARNYLATLDESARGVPGAATRHEYAVIHLIDQLCRHISGGEMLRFWRQQPLPEEEHIVAINGLEILQSLVAIRLSPPPTPEPVCQAEKRPTTWWRRLLGRAPVPAPVDAATQLGRFRLSGETHLWMYDHLSLRELLGKTGFSEIERQTATRSRIPDFALFALDTDTRGRTYKPESLFIEAIRPSLP